MGINRIAPLAALLLYGCANMTTGQKQTAGIIGGIVGAAVLVTLASDEDDVGSDSSELQCHTVIGGDGQGGTTSQQICQ